MHRLRMCLPTGTGYAIVRHSRTHSDGFPGWEGGQSAGSIGASSLLNGGSERGMSRSDPGLTRGHGDRGPTLDRRPRTDRVWTVLGPSMDRRWTSCGNKGAGEDVGACGVMEVDMEAHEEEEARRMHVEGMEKGSRHGMGTGGVFKSAAVKVLRKEMRLMSTGEVCRMALKCGIIQCSGKTPEATMASCMYTDIRKKVRAVFVRPLEGAFGLKEWEQSGFLDQAIAQYQEENPDKLPIAKKKNMLKNHKNSTRMTKKSVRDRRYASSSDDDGPNMEPTEEEVVNTRGRNERIVTVEDAGPSTRSGRCRLQLLEFDARQAAPQTSSAEDGVSLLLDAAETLIEGGERSDEKREGEIAQTSRGGMVELEIPSEIARGAMQSPMWGRKTVVMGEDILGSIDDKWESPKGGMLTPKLEFSNLMMPRVESTSENGMEQDHSEFRKLRTPTSRDRPLSTRVRMDPANAEEAELELQILEEELGNQDPTVGKAWLKRARELQIDRQPVQARNALLHAWAIFRNCVRAIPGAEDCTPDFKRLLDSTFVPDPSDPAM